MKERNKEYQKTGKEQDLINPEDLLEYIWLFIHLFNKKKSEKLPDTGRCTKRVKCQNLYNNN